MKNCEQTIRLGLKLQEETARWWSNVLHQSPAVPEWQRAMESWASLAADAIPATQKRAEEMVEVVDKANRQAMELMKQSIEVVQCSNERDRYSKAFELWSDTLKAGRSNAEQVVAVGNKAIDSWMGYVRKQVDILDSAAAKAA